MLVDLFELAGRMPANLLRLLTIVFVPTAITCAVMCLEHWSDRRAF